MNSAMSWLTQEIWFGVAFVIGVVGLCVLGYFYNRKDDGPLIVLEAMLVGICAAFWPILLIVVIVCGIVSLPVFLGMYIKKYKSAYDQVKKEKYEKMNDAEKIMKK